MKFLGYTVGLECHGHGKFANLVKVEFQQLNNGNVRLQAVSGRNLAKQAGSAVLSEIEYEDLPFDNVERAVHCLRLCGWVPSGLSR